MNLVDELFAVTRVLHEAGIAHAVCGGIAVTIHGAPRSTKDIDILIARADLARALAAVATVGFDLPANPMTFGHGTPQERYVQRVSKLEDGQHLILDFLVADGVLQPIFEDRLEMTLPDGPLSVVSLAGLLEMKRMSGRPQDLADIEKLGQRDGA
jgi:hypothetical protein